MKNPFRRGAANSAATAEAKEGPELGRQVSDAAAAAGIGIVAPSAEAEEGPPARNGKRPSLPVSEFSVDALGSGDPDGRVSRLSRRLLGRRGRRWCGCDASSTRLTKGLRLTCLNPRLSLRRQLFLSFGLTSFFSLSLVTLTAILVTLWAGAYVDRTSRTNLERWATTNLGPAGRYVAESVSRKLDNLHGMAGIMAEVARDRFVGYPDLEGYEGDEHVPFFDVDTERNVYPLETDPLPLDWQIGRDVTDENHMEHVQRRWRWYDDDRGDVKLSTATGAYRMRGACDPSQTDPDSKSYYPNCTQLNNDVATGGAVAPTSANAALYRKAADLNFVLKPLYEYGWDIKQLGVFFANEGAGSAITFPAHELDGTLSYVSAGCDWMSRPHPLNASRTMATEEIRGRCHEEGERVPLREYNPLERRWCQKQALNPERAHSDGPYLDADSKHLWLMTFGKAVYDRKTGEFVACTLLDVAVDRITEVLETVRIENDGDGESSFRASSQIALVRWDDGTVVASSLWNSSSAQNTTTIASLDGMGVDREVFEELKGKVDFASGWDPKEVRSAYERPIHREGTMVSGFPISVPPNEYDEEYVPEFMVILAIEESAVLEPCNVMSQLVNEKVDETIKYTVIIGFAGMAAILVLICAVSFCITTPLLRINSVGKHIVEKFGQGLKLEDDFAERKKTIAVRCSPDTELTALVVEFQKMVRHFSGKGTAVIVKNPLTETRNPFDLFEEFQELYRSRQEPGFKYSHDTKDGFTYKLPGADSGPATSDGNKEAPPGSNDIPAQPQRCNFGPIVRASDEWTAGGALKSMYDPNDANDVLSSRLFWWIVGSAILPLLIAMIVISVLVTLNISKQLPTFVTDVEAAFVTLEENKLFFTAKLRAALAADLMDGAVRNLYLLSRVAGWLLFGGLKRSDGFTEIITGTEDCKGSPQGTCYHLVDPSFAVCDCDWNDDLGVPCKKFTDEDDSRYLQKQHFYGQSQDAWPNGDRNFTSFPKVAFSPNTTAWWDSAKTVPGFEKGPQASGFETTYDRLRVMSALSVIQIPLYNFDKEGKSGRPIGTYIGFEADGMTVAYTGCSHEHVEEAYWKSADGNKAYKLQPSLCPKDKYGYDPRCRGWYATGKSIEEETGSPLHVTAPYEFAIIGLWGQGATLPLVDAITGQLVGISLLDFQPQQIYDSLSDENTPLAPGGFPILITERPDNLGADTVLGPGVSFGGKSKPIVDAVLPDDDCSGNDSQRINCLRFKEILDGMRSGNATQTDFFRKAADGTEEKVHVSYAPVFATSLSPRNSSDFSRGVDFNEKTLVYSLGVAEPRAAILAPFQTIESDMNRVLRVSITVLSILSVLAAAVAIYVSSRVTVSITVPIAQLLAIVKIINRCDIQEELPDFDGGSKEVSSVYSTFNRLYMLVQCGNTSLFAGDLEKAYEMLEDALELFTRLDDRKAVGIVANNLGCTMLASYRTMNDTAFGGVSFCGMSKKEAVVKGKEYFDLAIDTGEEAIAQTNNEVGWSPDYLVFMQQLSNRYFNRAMFLLTVRNDCNDPDEAEQTGFSDLSTAKDMDTEVVDNGDREGFEGDDDVRFNLLLGRIRGLLTLMDMGYPDNWDIEEHINDAQKELTAAMKNPAHILFRDVGPAGRMQQLDALILGYIKTCSGNITEAARIGIRMLVEDEYVLLNEVLVATQALLDYIDEVGPDDEINKQTARQKLLQYRAKLLEILGFTNMTIDSTIDTVSSQHIEGLRRPRNQVDGTIESYFWH